MNGLYVQVNPMYRYCIFQFSSLKLIQQLIEKIMIVKLFGQHETRWL